MQMAASLFTCNGLAGFVRNISLSQLKILSFKNLLIWFYGVAFSEF